MEQFLRSCVDRYLEVAGDVKLNKVVTPGIHEETKDHVSRRPVKEGPSVMCNWCNNLVPTDGSGPEPDQKNLRKSENESKEEDQHPINILPRDSEDCQGSIHCTDELDDDEQPD